MADGDDVSAGLRDTHYSQQRSPPRSQSSQVLPDVALRDQDEQDTRETSSASPVIPRRRQSLDNGMRGRGHARRGSSRATTGDGRNASRGRTIDEYLAPDNFANLAEVAAPSILDSRRHSTLEEERVQSRAGRRSRLSSLRPSPLSRSGTPATDLDITALPVLPGEEGAKTPSDEYMATKASRARRRASRFATELYTVSYLILFSILGTLARLGLQWLAFYPGAPVTFPVLWANVGGTLFIGFLAEDCTLFRQEWGRSNASKAVDHVERTVSLSSAAKASHAKVKKTIPLYIGLATGFCGSFTSFSSFMRDAFFALSNDMPSPLNHPYPPGTPDPSTASTMPRNGGYSFMAVCAVIVTTVALCYAALRFGAHLAVYMDAFKPVLPFHFFRRVVDPLMVVVAWGTWTGAIIMAIWPPDSPSGPQSKGTWAAETWRGQALFACVFAPAGCLVRFYLSLTLNAVIASFPLGTFAVNIFGTAVLGMAYDLQHVRIGASGVSGGRLTCQILQGLMDGFCGALTTVSTWVLELSTLRKGHAYVYGAVSMGVGLGVLVIVMGSVRWTVGWTGAACVT